MSDLDLFGRAASAAPPDGPAPRPMPAQPPEELATQPLATRMRPRDLGEIVGQARLLDEGRALRVLVEADAVPSLILWGPPGSGKTTLARVVASHVSADFVPFSAVSEGVPRLRKIFAAARERARAGRGTLLFIDEIHRLNRAQQDALLPSVESGLVTMIGATTENPSFEVNGALLSRARVFVLEPLSPEALRSILDRALREDPALTDTRPDEDALEAIVVAADGDARRALNALEIAAALAGPGRLGAEHAREALQRRVPRYDKSGEGHYDHISALHKAVRGSDPDGALYWLARMLEGGEDPLYIARRLVRMASEDIGLAEPRALGVTIAARDAYHFLGSPEGDLALAEAAVFLAAAPKSNRVYEAFGRAREAARETPAEPVPLHLRNAVTELMGDLGYGAGYRYAFDDPTHHIPQTYLPDALGGATFYRPSGHGEEVALGARLERWRARAGDAGAAGSSGPEASGGADGSPPPVHGIEEDA
ncbi:MAG TPA: replication-associated recombination protein A [Longimicrobiales bacterium]|nr:replication-associated recombination protein A [Longimicrobiales bacterium]